MFNEEYTKDYYTNHLGLPCSNIWFGVHDKDDWGGDNPEIYFTTEYFYLYADDGGRPQGNMSAYLLMHNVDLGMLTEISGNLFELNDGITLDAVTDMLEIRGIVRRDIYCENGWLIKGLTS